MANLDSAVNIKGIFNTSNETKYEKDPPGEGKLFSFTSIVSPDGFPPVDYIRCFAEIFKANDGWSPKDKEPQSNLWILLFC